MLELTTTIDIDAPVDAVWTALAKLDDVQNFVDSVNRSYYSTSQTEGVGAARTCEVSGFGTLVETIVDWKDGETLTYAIEGMPKIVKHAESKWRLEPKNQSRTTLYITSSVETRYGAVGRLMEMLALKPKLATALKSIAQQLKAHVERSQPATALRDAPLQTNAA